MRRILVLSSIIFVVLLLAGCQSPAEPTPAANQMSDAVSLPTESASDEPQTAATEITEDPTPENSPTETPTEIAAITPEPADECIECHQNKQRLIDTAKPEEEQVSESSGEG